MIITLFVEQLQLQRICLIPQIRRFDALITTQSKPALFMDSSEKEEKVYINIYIIDL